MYYRAGKQAYLSGKPCVAPQGLTSQETCDFRSGWRVAENNRINHPDWSDEYILL